MKKIMLPQLLFLLCGAAILGSCVGVRGTENVDVPLVTPKNTVTPTAENATPIFTAQKDPSLQDVLGLPKGTYIIYSNKAGFHAYSFDEDHKILLLKDDGWMAVSSNGQYLAYFDESSTNLTILDFPRWEIDTYQLNAECRFMAIASNGRWIACGGGDIYLYSTEEEERILLTTWSKSKPEDTWEFPVWSPDDTTVAYQNLRDFVKSKDDGLYFTNIECAKKRETCEDFTVGPFVSDFAFLGGSTTSVSWLHDGETLLLPSIDKIYQYDIKSDVLTVLVDEFGAYGVALSPVGNQIAFTAFLNGEIYLMSSEGRDITALDIFGDLIGWLIVP